MRLRAKNAPPAYAVRPRDIERSVRQARTQREQAKCLKAALDFYSNAPKRKGVRSFVLKHAKLIFRDCLTGRERREVRQEIAQWKRALALYKPGEEMSGWETETHTSALHFCFPGCPECYSELILSILERRRQSAG